MSISMMSARHFARDLAEAKDMANNGPVIVTARGKPAYALLSIDDYYALSHVSPRTLLEVMDGLAGRMPDADTYLATPPRTRRAQAAPPYPDTPDGQKQEPGFPGGADA